MSETKAFCERLALDFPGVRTILDEHVAYHEELLPHVFLGDLTRYLLAGGKDKTAIVQRLEDAISTGIPAIDELIAVSFVENIEKHFELEEALMGVNGNKLRDAWDLQHRFDLW